MDLVYLTYLFKIVKSAIMSDLGDLVKFHKTVQKNYERQTQIDIITYVVCGVILLSLTYIGAKVIFKVS